MQEVVTSHPFIPTVGLHVEHTNVFCIIEMGDARSVWAIRTMQMQMNCDKFIFNCNRKEQMHLDCKEKEQYPHTLHRAQYQLFSRNENFDGKF